MHRGVFQRLRGVDLGHLLQRVPHQTRAYHGRGIRLWRAAGERQIDQLVVDECRVRQDVEQAALTGTVNGRYAGNRWPEIVVGVEPPELS